MVLCRPNSYFIVTVHKEEYKIRQFSGVHVYYFNNALVVAYAGLRVKIKKWKFVTIARLYYIETLKIQIFEMKSLQIMVCS